MSLHRSAKKLFSKASWRAYNTYRKGLNFPSQLTQTTELFNAPRQDITQYQSERLKNLICHANRTTPYYSKLFQEIGFNEIDLNEHINIDHIDISIIRSLQKQNIREQTLELCSEAFSPKERIKNATGGSTGTPLSFYQDRHYWNQRNLSVYYFDRWGGWDFGDPQLIIWGSLVDVKRQGDWKQNFNRYWRNQYWLNGFQLTDSEMYHTYKRMRRWKPNTILSYPSSLYQFARFLTENKLSFNWGVKGIISSAEMLHTHYKSLAESVFETRVFNRYGGREVGLIAMECSEGRMHINCRDLYLEIDSPDPYSQPGDILITQLNNYIMPFIRYRIGDIGRLSDELCPCGIQLPVLAELLGRSTATFKTKEGTFIHGGYFTQQFYNLSGVLQFQLIQETLSQCTLRLVINDAWNEQTGLNIQEKIQEVLGSDVSVTIEFVNDIPISNSGKREFTISKVT